MNSRVSNDNALNGLHCAVAAGEMLLAREPANNSSFSSCCLALTLKVGCWCCAENVVRVPVLGKQFFFLHHDGGLHLSGATTKQSMFFVVVAVVTYSWIEPARS